jgi:CheY-like chemotaxis protein
MAVLIVEDDQAVGAMLAELLVDEGYRTTTVTDGLEALHHLERAATSVRLILLDLMMPRMGGKAFLLERRQRPALAAIPVLVLSAYPGFGKMARAAGVSGSLSKPVCGVALLEEVRRLYREHEATVGYGSGSGKGPPDT